MIDQTLNDLPVRQVELRLREADDIGRKKGLFQFDKRDIVLRPPIEVWMCDNALDSDFRAQILRVAGVAVNVNARECSLHAMGGSDCPSLRNHNGAALEMLAVSDRQHEVFLGRSRAAKDARRG